MRRITATFLGNISFALYMRGISEKRWFESVNF